MKKVYFACSIRGRRDDAATYGQLVSIIKKHAEVLSEIFVDKTLTAHGMSKPETEIWKTDTTWIKEADALIAEVTNPSLGVGYEIAKAEEWGKPVLALYRPSPTRRLSAMIAGSPQVQLVEYEHVTQTQATIATFLGNL